MSPDPRPDAEQVIAGTVLQELRRRKGFWGWWDGISEDVQDEIACVLGAAALEALRAANIPVGPVDALRYAEERLLEDATVSDELPGAQQEAVWPDQSAVHGVLLEQVKDAYAEGIADTVAKLRIRAAEVLPEVARFTLDEIEVAAADLSASSTAEKLASPRKHSASASDPMPLCDCEFCARPLRDHEEEAR